MKDTVFDWQRTKRTGVPEAVFCAGKSNGQIAEIIHEADKRQHNLLLTKLSPGQYEGLLKHNMPTFDYDPVSQTAILDHGITPPVDAGIAIVSAGTSDARIAREAQRTLQFSGFDALVIPDVGVAGLWRMIEREPELRDRRVIIAVAGMEGALFSVIAGLVRAIVIAVPTSVGYGVAEGGRVALDSALSSCAPGILTVNIDNGFGAACAAIKIVGQGALSGQ
jgi:NCAIR mutase (PurE)-related protein